ncbi:MAG: hypothetical protein CMP68_01525 [Flavobacteriales bacterium]|nr:hypothetical protein [Flavobacteriales bacterium]|tara:strand:- start:14895 stop:15080 length:186 start_codon:yes stop_codon:yes gene_type:complete
MNKNFTKKQIDILNIFLKQELKCVDDQILINKISNKSSKKFIIDYSKSLMTVDKSFFFILN